MSEPEHDEWKQSTSQSTSYNLYNVVVDGIRGRGRIEVLPFGYGFEWRVTVEGADRTNHEFGIRDLEIDGMEADLETAKVNAMLALEHLRMLRRAYRTILEIEKSLRGHESDFRIMVDVTAVNREERRKAASEISRVVREAYAAGEDE